jgi:hypothetical protein
MRLHRSVDETMMKSSVRRRDQRVETATRRTFADAKSLPTRSGTGRLMAGVLRIVEMQAACAH